MVMVHKEGVWWMMLTITLSPLDRGLFCDNLIWNFVIALYFAWIATGTWHICGARFVGN